MFVGDKLKVALVTRHIPLRKVLIALTIEKIFTTIKLSSEALIKFFGITYPKIAVAGLNPHSGEGGTLGKEEITTIIPAIEKAKKAGYNSTGPYPADTIFTRALKGEFDLVIAMYHDQGLIPVKMFSPDAVNVTVGLPFIRTSPSHGTAYDIAGKGVADPTSMINAINLAYKMACVEEKTLF